MFLTLMVSIAILLGAYGATFGLPDQVAALFNTDAQTPAASEPTEQRRPGNRPGGRNQSVTVVTVPIAFQSYETLLQTIGTATAQRSTDVKSNAAGEVVEVNMAANTEVQAEDVLLRLDARVETLNLEIMQAQLDQANETVERYDRLVSNGNASVTNVAISDARIAQRLAQANVGLAQVALDDRSVQAPISGRLGLSDIEVGDVLTANETIVTIDDDEALFVEFELPERSIGILTEVDTVLTSTPTFRGRVFTGQIVSFDSRLDSVTRSVTVKARIENDAGILWPGMTFSVRILHESDPLPSIPSTAITWSRDGSSIWTVVDGSARQVPVTILSRKNETVWIEGDVADGVLVVSEGAQKLREGSQVNAPTSARPEQNRPAPRDDTEIRSDATPTLNPNEEPA